MHLYYLLKYSTVYSSSPAWQENMVSLPATSESDCFCMQCSLPHTVLACKSLRCSSNMVAYHHNGGDMAISASQQGPRLDNRYVPFRIPSIDCFYQHPQLQTPSKFTLDCPEKYWRLTLLREIVFLVLGLKWYLLVLS